MPGRWMSEPLKARQSPGHSPDFPFRAEQARRPNRGNPIPRGPLGRLFDFQVAGQHALPEEMEHNRNIRAGQAHRARSSRDLLGRSFSARHRRARSETGEESCERLLQANGRLARAVTKLSPKLLLAPTSCPENLHAQIRCTRGNSRRHNHPTRLRNDQTHSLPTSSARHAKNYQAHSTMKNHRDPAADFVRMATPANRASRHERLCCQWGTGVPLLPLVAFTPPC